MPQAAPRQVWVPEDLPDLSKAINREPDQSDERSTLHGFEYRFVEETVRIQHLSVQVQSREVELQI